LLQSFVGRSVQLELEDVDIVRSLDDAVHPSFALLLLGIDGVAAYHPHEQVERVVEVTVNENDCPTTIPFGCLRQYINETVTQSLFIRVTAIFSFPSFDSFYYFFFQNTGLGEIIPICLFSFQICRRR